jgi:hypothetical protein
LETLSSQVLEFEGKARANPINWSTFQLLLGKLLALPANVRLDWKVIARYKHSLAYLASSSATKEKSFITLTPDLVATMIESLDCVFFFGETDFGGEDSDIELERKSCEIYWPSIFL